MSDINRISYGSDDPSSGPLDPPAKALDGHDDPNRGPLDRTEGAFFGHDDPNRGPLDRVANAVTGGSGGINAATGDTTSDASAVGNMVVSAIFDTQDEARQAVAELRNSGFSDDTLSVIAQKRGTMTTRDADGEITDEDHSNVLRGILGGGALGAGLGVLALAIPGVGPLAALGAIAASAVPEAVAIGAAVGATAGTFNEVLLKHGVSDEDSAYYGEKMKSGGVLVTVYAQAAEATRAEEILSRRGGHSSSNPRNAAM